MKRPSLYLGILAAGVSALSLGACSHPNAMPTGYTYHNEMYKSPAPPPSSKITTEQRQYMDGKQAEQFRDAVYDLVKRLSGRAGMPPKPVYVLAPDPMTTFYANIDNDLRESMRHLGYAISDVPTGAYVFAYDARLLTKPRGQISTGEPNVELVLRVFDSIGEDARMLTEESGHYYIQGAEVLHIQPSFYSLLPSRDKIMLQAEGFDPAANPRTASHRQYNPSKTREVTRQRMMETTPQAYDAPMMEPNPRMQPSAVPMQNYDGPSQAVVIDSNGMSYENEGSASVPQVNREPLSPRSSVSRYRDY
jgi:hypothetical protein